MLKTSIIDPATGKAAVVAPDGELLTYVTGVPPYGHGEQDFRIYRAYFRDAAASNDMRVDGSTTNQDFYVQAHQDNDRYICTISVQIADASSTLAKFGNLAALTNGVRLFYQADASDVDIHDAIKTNADMVRLSQGQPAFGDATTAFQFPNIGPPGVPVIGYMPSIDLRRIFGLTYGVKLDAGSTHRLIFRIRDDLSAGIDQFDAIAYGFDRLPE